MKFHFIDAERARFPVLAMCRVLDVKRSSFYYWCGARKRPDRRVGSDEAELRRQIREIHRSSRGSYGRPRIHAELRARGWRVSAKRVGRLMILDGLRGRGRRPRAHTEKAQVQEPSPNVLKRKFRVAAPNRVWVGDIKMVRINAKAWYIAAVVDLHARVVVGLHVSDSSDASLVCRALRDALDARQRKPGALIFHSDQGIQYRSQRFRLMLEVHRIRQSMSRRGNCWDNAAMESFFATLELECIRPADLSSGAQLRAAINSYLPFYNGRRRHSTLGYKSPREFETAA